MSQIVPFIVPQSRIQEVKIHPLVIFQIIDQFLRRNQGQKRVIGTLLGTINDKYVEITNCFGVPHLEKNKEVALGKDYHKEMYALHQCVNTMEQVVGWYATTNSDLPGLISEQSCLIHEFYGSECDDPVHLVLDTSLNDDILNISAFISSPLSTIETNLNSEIALISQFEQIKINNIMNKSESAALAIMTKAMNEEETAEDKLDDNNKETEKEIKNNKTCLPSNLLKVEVQIKEMYNNLTKMSNYIDKVLEGKEKKDVKIARCIQETLFSVPYIEPKSFENSFNNSLQDILMVSYLSGLTQAQLAMTDKLMNI